MKLPVTAMPMIAATSITANNGVKTLVSTGAMFSITLCFASTSQATTTTAPTAPHGSTHDVTNRLTSMSIASKTPSVRAMRTTPPNAISV